MGQSPKWGAGGYSAYQPSTSQTGIVTVNRPLDRERIPDYKLTISVKDNPDNPRIARRVRLEGTGGAGLGAGPSVRCTGFGVSKRGVQIPAPPVSRCVALASQVLSASILSPAK